jgi:hypothetical protein
MAALPVEYFSDNDKDVPRLHGDGDVHDVAGVLWHII